MPANPSAAAPDIDVAWARRDGAVWRQFRTSILIVDDDAGYHRVDGAAALVWSVLEEPATIRELSADLVAVNGVELTKAEALLLAAVSALAEKDLIRPARERT